MDPGLEHRGIRRESSLQPGGRTGVLRHIVKEGRELRRCALCPPRHHANPQEIMCRWRGCKGSSGCPSSLGRGLWKDTHVPTVVHSHEISNKQEGVGQHAYCNLKDRQTSVPACPLPGPPGPVRPASSPPWPTKAVSRTYPHHKLGIAPDGQGLAEL